MSTRDELHVPRVDHPNGPGADLSEDDADAARRTLARWAIRTDATSDELGKVLAILGLVDPPPDPDARARPLGGTRRTSRDEGDGD